MKIKKWLTSQEDIEGYFKNNGNKWLDCGQGYYEDATHILCKIQDKFYNVYIKAEIMSARQDRGDRLYWVDYIEEVRYEEVDKPLPKKRRGYKLLLNLTKSESKQLCSYLESKKINYTII